MLLKLSNGFWHLAGVMLQIVTVVCLPTVIMWLVAKFFDVLKLATGTFVSSLLLLYYDIVQWNTVDTFFAFAFFELLRRMFFLSVVPTYSWLTPCLLCIIFPFDTLSFGNVPTGYTAFEHGSHINLTVERQIRSCSYYENDKCILVISPVYPHPCPH